jgi:hypothetical protein
VPFASANAANALRPKDEPMKQADWLTGSNPDTMVAFLADRASDRQWRLFTAGCLREVGHLLIEHRTRQAFLVLQAFADGQKTEEELAVANRTAAAAHGHLFSSGFPRGNYDRRILPRVEAAHQALVRATMPGLNPRSQAVVVSSTLRFADYHDPAWRQRISKTQCDLLRDLFGNPFRPVRVPKRWLRTIGQQAAEVARAIYDDRSFDELGILADALLDADCPRDELVRHCRENGPHGRGCWVVDALLGKT